MEEQIISFTVAKLAKEKGFNEVSDGCFDKNGKKYSGMNHKNEIGKGVFSAPTQSLLQKWLREKYAIQVTPKYNTYNVYEGKYLGYQCEVYDFKNGSKIYKTYESYEKALEKGLQEALKLI